MTEFTKKKFSVAVGSESYRDNWEKTFGESASSLLTPDEKKKLRLYEAAGYKLDADGTVVQAEPPVSAYCFKCRTQDCIVLVQAENTVCLNCRDGKGPVQFPKRPSEPTVTTTCAVCSNPGLSMEEDGGPEAQLADGRWVCSERCWNQAVLDIDLAHVSAELQRAVGMLMRVPHPRSVEVSNAENVLCLLLELLP